MRFAPRLNTLFNSAPFAGEGVSLYVGNPGDTVPLYRRLRLICGRGRLGCTTLLRQGTFGVGGTSVLKTARVASVSSPTTSIAYAIPAGWHSQTVPVDVRHYKDNVECEVTQPTILTFDSGGASLNEILGTAYLLDQQQRDGGLMILQIVWQPSTSGVQPDSFTLHRTAGPTSPADVVVSYNGTDTVIEFDTGALSDVSPYTFSVTCADAVSGATATLLTGISVQADATGPGAPAGGGAAAW